MRQILTEVSMPKKFLIVLLIVSLFVMGMGGLGVEGLKNVRNNFVELESHVGHSLETTAAMKDTMNQAVLAAQEYALTGNPRYRARAVRLLNRTDELEQQYRKSARGEFVDGIESRQNETVHHAHKLIQVVDENAADTIIEQQSSSLASVHLDMITFYQEDVDPHFKAERQERTKEIQAAFKKPIQLFYLTGGLFLISAILIWLLATVFITSPLQDLTQTIQRISKGDLSAEIDSSLKERGDEIGDLANAFDRTLASMKLVSRRATNKEPS